MYICARSIRATTQTTRAIPSSSQTQGEIPGKSKLVIRKRAFDQDMQVLHAPFSLVRITDVCNGSAAAVRAESPSNVQHQ